MRSQHLIVLDRQLEDLNYLSSSVGYQRNFQDRLNIIKMILDIMDRKEKLTLAGVLIGLGILTATLFFNLINTEISGEFETHIKILYFINYILLVLIIILFITFNKK